MYKKNNIHNIVAVVVTYNRKNYITKCINCILKQNQYICDILVIDNASTDGTEKAIQNIDSPLLIYKNTGKNLGGAGGFNYGIKYACQLEYKYIWIMDDDTLPDSNALRKFILADHKLNGNYGWLSSHVLWKDGKDCEMNIQRRTPYKKIIWNDKNLVPSSMASFVSLFIPVRNILKYGLPIKDFFIWSDDWEFTRRISICEKCYSVKNSIVIHAMENPLPVNISTDTNERLPRYNYFYRNDVYMYRREGLIGWIWVLSKFLWHTIQVIFKGDKKIKKIAIIWKGFFNGIKFNPNIEFPISK